MSIDGPEHIFRRYEEQLSQLRERLLGMGGLAEQRVRDAVDALVQRNTELALRVAAGDEPLNQLHKEIDDHCFKLLALRQPLAVDLRVILAAVKINTDLERIGDLAVNIGEAVCRYLTHRPVDALIDIPRMAELSERMLRDALDSYLRRDAALAQSVLERDNELDALKDEVFRELLIHMLQNPSSVEPSLDLILISRHLERIGDHATNIAEDVIFVVLARDVRHHAPHGDVPGASAAPG
jgi:phosphate transport system protein